MKTEVDHWAWVLPVAVSIMLAIVCFIIIAITWEM